MKKFQFRLQRLLWYHQQRQKQAEVKLQQAALQREAAQAEVREVQRQIDRSCQLPESPGKIVNLALRVTATAHLEILGRNLTVAREKLMVMDQRLREANEAHVQVTRDVEGLMHLRGQQFAEYQDDIARQQQILLDEVVMRQWSKREAGTTD